MEEIQNAEIIQYLNNIIWNMDKKQVWKYVPMYQSVDYPSKRGEKALRISTKQTSEKGQFF